jgi:transcriptional regulator with PAS, ATPase and Fis domain
MEAHMKITNEIRNSRCLEDLLPLLIPGKGNRTAAIREIVLGFARNPLGRNLFIEGPVGSGKSTMARVIALARHLAFLKVDRFQDIVRMLKYDGPMRLDRRLLDHYEEINVTSLVPELALSQLFGIAKGVATGVVERAGLFEQAMYGHQTKASPSAASAITQGVVFMDEIGDLHPNLQPMLLSVLTGAEVFRVGAEGNHDYGFSFEGCVISATKGPIEKLPLRSDLVSRLTSYRITLPSISQREEELEMIVNTMFSDIVARLSSELARLTPLPDIEKSKLEVMRQSIRPLEKREIALLAQFDWSKNGELRGLRSTLERRILSNTPIGVLLEQSGVFAPSPESCVSTKHALIEAVEMPGVDQLIDAIKKVEQSSRTQMIEIMRTSPDVRSKILRKFRLSDRDLNRQLVNLARNRRGGHK